MTRKISSVVDALAALALGFCCSTVVLSAQTRTPPPTPRPVVPARLSMSADGIQHMTRQQAQVACLIGWVQGVGAGAPDELATVMNYLYLAETDAASGNASGGFPLTVQCAAVPTTGTPSAKSTGGPFPCQTSYLLPVKGQTIGSHTLSVSTSDTNGQTGTATIQYIVDPDIYGPPPAPAGLKFVGGTVAK